MIEGIKVKKLKVIADERGRLMEGLRNDDDIFMKFGQMYVTSAYPGVVKGWHYHKKQVDNFVAVKGMFKTVLYDGRDNSPTKGEINEFFMGEHNPILLQIPVGVLHGFKCIGEEEAIMTNCPSEVYHYKNPDEFRVAHDSKDVPYDWSRKNQ